MGEVGRARRARTLGFSCLEAVSLVCVTSHNTCLDGRENEAGRNKETNRHRSEGGKSGWEHSAITLSVLCPGNQYINQ